MTDLKLVERPVNLTSCVYCHDVIEYSDSTWQCPRCSTLQHDVCAGEHGRCSVFGCEATVAPRDHWQNWRFVSGVRPSRVPLFRTPHVVMIVGLACLLAAGYAAVNRSFQ